MLCRTEDNTLTSGLDDRKMVYSVDFEALEEILPETDCLVLEVDEVRGDRLMPVIEVVLLPPDDDILSGELLMINRFVLTDVELLETALVKKLLKKVIPWLALSAVLMVTIDV